MYCYRVNGLVIGMPESVSGLAAASSAIEPDTVITWTGLREPRNMPSVCEPGWAPAGFAGKRSSAGSSELWFRDSGGERQYLLRAGRGYASEFTIVSPGRRVEACWTNPAIDKKYLVRLMLGPVLGLILRIKHRLALHAGAVATHGGAVALLGPSGSGKSTLIASLLGHECALLADDLIQVEEKEGVPVLRHGQPGLRLWPGALEALNCRPGDFPVAFPYSSKRAVGVGSVVSADAVPLLAVFFLGPRRAAVPVSLDRLSPCEALTLLLGQLYPPFLPVNAEEHGSLFVNMSRLVARVPVYRVERGDGFAILPELSRRIIQVAAAQAGP